MIEIRNVSKTYGQSMVVDGVTLALPKGGVTSIIGPNGAGKSTLLSLIARLVPASGGSIAVDGLDVARTRGDVLAKRLAFLRQENGIAARLTVRDLVAFGRYPHSKGRPTAEDARHVDSALGLLGLGDLADRFLDQLSGGQRQRAFIAMVVAQDADYTLFDEPLNNLDMAHAVSIMKLLRRAADDLGRTVVVVLHDVNFASCYSDHIVAMRAGQVAHQGAPREIMRSEVLRDLYGLDIAVSEQGGRLIADYFG